MRAPSIGQPPEALAEARRVLRPGGRLAFSDVVVDGDLPDVPATTVEALRPAGSRDRETVLGVIEAASSDLGAVEGHRGDLLATRDELAGAVDYEELPGTWGRRSGAPSTTSRPRRRPSGQAASTTSPSWRSDSR